MDSVAYGILSGIFYGALAALPPPAQGGVVCDRRGFCVEQPQFQQPYYPPPPVIQQPSRLPPPPPPQQQDALGAQVKQEILQFCAINPQEHFCGTLEAYLQKHPAAR